MLPLGVPGALVVGEEKKSPGPLGAGRGSGGRREGAHLLVLQIQADGLYSQRSPLANQ